MAKKHQIPVAETPTPVSVKTNIMSQHHKVKAFFVDLVSTKKRRIITIVCGIFIVSLLVLIIPATRYFILAPIVKKDVSVYVIDSKTDQPVSNAFVSLNGVSGQTNKDGKITLNSVPVGQKAVEVSKQYYESNEQAYTVPVFSSPQQVTLALVATGRSVVLGVSNKISGEPLPDVTLKYGQAEATTNDKGEVVLIVKPDTELQNVTISKPGYNTQEVQVKTNQPALQPFALSPAGSIYFLSKASGNIDVIKSNLDGTDPQTVIPGTGQELDNETSLLSSRDWKYSALSATRGDQPGVYLWDSAKGDLSVIDEGNATFGLVGWSGHNFIYIVYRNTPNYWDDKKQALKSFNAQTRKLTTLDETAGGGTSSYWNKYEYFSSVFILKDEIVYAKNWAGSIYDIDMKASLVSVGPSDGNKRVVKTFTATSVELKLYEPQEIYIREYIQSNDTKFYEYENKNIKNIDTITENKFNDFYSTFLISPSGEKTFWYEPRNGKNTLFIGDQDSENERVFADMSEFVPYGWHGDNDQYVLLTKNGSELYIASADKVLGKDGYQPIKISDYHQTRTYVGYGYGYGGQ